MIFQSASFPVNFQPLIFNQLQPLPTTRFGARTESQKDAKMPEGTGAVFKHKMELEERGINPKTYHTYLRAAAAAAAAAAPSPGPVPKHRTDATLSDFKGSTKTIQEGSAHQHKFSSTYLSSAGTSLVQVRVNTSAGNIV